MKKNFWHTSQDYEKVNGKDISLTEIQSVHRSLLEQFEGITREIVDAVDHNDYVKLSLLVTKRKQIQTAIEDIEAIYGSNLYTSHPLKDRVAAGLRNSTGSSKRVLQSVQSIIARLNHSIQSATSETLTVSSKAISTGNRLKFKAGCFIISQMSNRLVKLADALKKNP